MLQQLTVSNFAIVEKTVIDFSPGLTVITGETGAGKSVLMGALEFLLGGKADGTVVREGAKEAEVEAVFAGRTVRRTLTPQGRARGWIDDESVTVAELKDLGRQLIDVHGPTANQRILDGDWQRRMLDGYGRIDLAGYARCWREYAGLRRQLSDLEAEGGEDELDMLRFQAGELADAALTPEDETLSERHAAAAHAEEIAENANAVTEALGGDRSASEILIALQPRFRALARRWPAAEAWAREADELTCRLQELSRSVADAASKLEGGAEDLDELDRRLTLVNRLLRKYRAATVPELMALAESKRERLDRLEHREERLEELRGEILAAERKVREAGGGLTAKRRQAAAKLAKAMTRELRGLGFLKSGIEVLLEPCEPEESGLDRVVFMFAPNPGEPARPLAAIASSGEIARVMLALKVVAAEAGEGGSGSPTLIFDEIDANIGGETGKAVGEKLRAAAARQQVVAITHLPQSAVYGERHLVVSKASAAGRTASSVRAVEGEERISEIARMLGGEKLTSVARKHAEEMLQLSR